MAKRIVDIVASGYEWCCPKCGKLNKEIEWTTKVACKKCGRIWLSALPEHALGK